MKKLLKSAKALAVVLSLSYASFNAAPAFAVDPPVKHDSFVTPDLSFMELFGHVEMLMTWNGEYYDGPNSNYTVYMFDKAGKLINTTMMSEEEFDFYYSRDEKGRIVEGDHESYEYETVGNTLRLKALVWMHMGAGNETTYLYNANGFRIGEENRELIFDEDEAPAKPTKTMYNNVAYDKNGNWTKRIVNGMVYSRSVQYFE